MPRINMVSSAELVKGQGVGSAFYEQVHLVSEGLRNKYEVLVNSKKPSDIIHFHTINPEYCFRIATERKRSAMVGYVHFLPETMDESLNIPKIGKMAFYKYMIEFYKSMDYLVTVNPYFISELGRYGIPEKKITYIPNFVSEDRFYKLPPEEVAVLKKKYEIPLDKFIVLGVGQVQTRKGVMDFVEIAKMMPEVYFVWAGGFSFGAMTDGYRELKQIMLNPPENVSFVGIVEREYMNDVYNMADVMFLPSYNELFPMTILESMCVSKPILLRDLDIYEKILFDYYLKGSDNDAFVSLLKQLETDKDFYQKWSRKSFEGHNFYSKENVLHLWESFYDKVYAENCQRIMEGKGLNKKQRERLKKEILRLKKVGLVEQESKKQMGIKAGMKLVKRVKHACQRITIRKGKKG